MIKTFKDAETEKIYQRERSRKLPSNIQQAALRKLRMINLNVAEDQLGKRLEREVRPYAVAG
ncbi:MAG: hypothetical protein KJZ52_12435 [Anaerolineales bacterium]|nr:hypothetical protein [Anaerolineales bacterium]